MSSVKKILGTKVLDPMDVWGTQAEESRKQQEKQAQLDREAMQEARGNSAQSPTMDSQAVSDAREAERRRRAAGSGQNSTILTGAAGLGGNNNSGKQLLGQ